jgi:hypothetical protein
MPAAAKSPIRNPAASRERTRHVFARLMEGQSTAAIAAAEGLSVRRVQQIVTAELARREANPAEDYVIMQVARLERAVELLAGRSRPAAPRRRSPLCARSSCCPSSPPARCVSTARSSANRARSPR